MRFALLAAALALPITASAQIAYRTEIVGTGEDDGLEAAIEAGARLVRDQERPPNSVGGLIRRATDDIERVGSALRARGHFLGTVEITLAGRPLDDPGLPDLLGRSVEPLARIAVEPGPLYRFGRIELTGAETDKVTPATLPAQPGAPAIGGLVLESEADILERLAQEGRCAAAIGDRAAVVDHDTQTMDVTWGVASGPPCQFGPVTFTGLERVDEEFLRARIPFVGGTSFDERALDLLRADLVGLGVFASVRVTADESDAVQARADGETATPFAIPITVALEERLPRFFGVAARYGSSEGLSGEIYNGWRNLLGEAETLRLEAGAARLGESDTSDIDLRIAADFRKPDFLVRDMDLLATFEILRENPDAFDREAVVLTVGLERRFTPIFAGRAGMRVERSRITTDTEGTQDIFQVGFPVAIDLDRTFDPLDPTEGFRLRVDIETVPPFFGTTNGFLIVESVGTYYLDLSDEAAPGRSVLAGRARLGTAFAESRADLPADRRFFSGGGGSVRGYEFQGIGPEDVNGNPIGGRSVVELAVELRQRIGENWGIVPFLDLGSVSEELYPSFDEGVQIGAGVGVRYYTDFGPIRVDFATPVNPREDDGVIQFYIGLGQAF